LPADATELDKESTVIDAYQCDLTDREAVRAVFEKYGKGGIWGVIHIAVRSSPPKKQPTLTFTRPAPNRPTKQLANLPKFH
jgi:hypothetical protein